VSTPNSARADNVRQQWKTALAAGPDCVPIERVADADLTAHEQVHLETCPRCQTERALAMEFEAAEAAPDEGAAVSWIARETKRRVFPAVERAPARTGKWFRLPMWATSMAAALAVALGVFLVVRTPGLAPGDVQPATVYRATGVEIVSPVGEVGDVPTEFRWQAVPGAARYEVKVLEVDGTEIWRSTTQTTSAPLTDVVRAAAKPARTLTWTVTPLDAQGNNVGRPGTASFRFVQ
jgi:hypothetical protein